LEKAISKKIGRAMADYQMIKESDKILVAVSGGKDSMVLLEMLTRRRAFVPVRYDLIPVHVDLTGQGVPSGLRQFCQDRGYDLRVVGAPVFGQDATDQRTCFWCSWNRRKILFETAKSLGCGAIALGHHKDDIVQTIMMNQIFEGQISAMAPRQSLFQGRLVIIRPLAYLEEDEISALADEWRLSVSRCDCPRSGRTQRAVIGHLLRDLQKVCPNAKTNIFRSLQRVKTEYLLDGPRFS
jgi:tRNA 2-thiocytidine biosynthesis protein TtcA